MHPDKRDSIFPTSRIPMGLLQYMTNFFTAKPDENECHFDDFHYGIEFIITILGDMS